MNKCPFCNEEGQHPCKQREEYFSSWREIWPKSVYKSVDMSKKVKRTFSALKNV